MTPTRNRGSKNYHFDRRFRGVGRIQSTSGTAKLKEFQRRDGLLTKLARLGDYDTLRALKAGRLRIEDLVTADKSGTLHLIADSLRLHRPLAAAVGAWLPTSARAPQSRRRYKVSWERLRRVARLTDAHTVAILAELDWPTLRLSWGASDADFNRMRAMLSRFLTMYLGDKYHPFRRQVMARVPLNEEPEGRVPDATPATFWAIIAKADQRLQASYVTMCALGAGPAEYLSLTRAHLNPERLTVHIPGTKRRQRDRTVAVDERLWPWVDRGIPSPLAYRWLNRYWKRACAAAEVDGLRMYDLRHLSAQFAADAGATDRDLTVHLGHADPKMSHKYSRRRQVRTVAKAAADTLLEGREAMVG